VRDVRLWITGLGAVTALGSSAESLFGGLLTGRRPFRPVSLFDVSGQRAQFAAEVEALPEAPFARPDAPWSRTSLLALGAAREALAHAELDPRSSRVGLVVAGTTGGMLEAEGLLAGLHARPEARELLVELLSHPLTSTGDRLEEALGPFVRVRTLCSACSGGANALAVGAAWLLTGEVDAVLAGGADALCRLTFTGFNALAAVDPEPCRPFDRARRGLTLGEGAGFVVIERDARAVARKKPPIVELAGWAIGAEAHHITNPEADGRTASRLMTRAMERAGLDAASIDYVNAHGTGTPLNDPMEASAIRQALGAEAERVPVSSAKGHLGHTLGAAGAIEAVITAMAIARGVVPQTAGLVDPDPACPLVHVTRAPRPTRIRAALSNSFGFGGMDAVLLLSEPGYGRAHADRDRHASGRGEAIVVTGVAALASGGLFGGGDAATLLTTTEAAEAGLPATFEEPLDAALARRFDRPAKIGTLVSQRALEEALRASGELSRGVGIVLGSAFGNVDGSAAYMHRLFEKGPRFASPAEFPNLVPSSPVGHVSIYLRCEGPVLATADLATSGESAFAQALDLLSVGEAEAIVAGGMEERSGIVERILGALFALAPRETSSEPRPPRSEGGGALVLESEDVARARGVVPLARVRDRFEWRGDAGAALALLDPPRDAARALVVVPRELSLHAGFFGASPWGRVAVASTERASGHHEAQGALALAAAAACLGRGDVDEVLVLGLAKGRGYAFVLEKP
jgi:3-oxoacyl-[acyl-carrier-protein] synthase II